MIDIQQLWKDAYMAKMAAGSARAKQFADQAVADYKASCPCPAGELVPVYRLRSGEHYLYTVDEGERDNAIATYGYVLEGVAFCAYRAP